MTRLLYNIIGELLQRIPCDESVLRMRLERVRKPLNFRAPETMYREWLEVGEILESHFPPTVRWSAWQPQVVALFLNITLEEVHHRFPNACGIALGP